MPHAEEKTLRSSTTMPPVTVESCTLRSFSCSPVERNALGSTVYLSTSRDVCR